MNEPTAEPMNERHFQPFELEEATDAGLLVYTDGEHFQIRREHRGVLLFQPPDIERVHAFISGYITCRQLEGRIQATADELQTQLDRVTNMSGTLRQILGRPNFACVQLAALLRLDAQRIPKTSTAEQAAVIHWILCLYIKHGDTYGKAAEAEIDRLTSELNNSEGQTNATT